MERIVTGRCGYLTVSFPYRGAFGRLVINFAVAAVATPTSSVTQDLSLPILIFKSTLLFCVFILLPSPLLAREGVNKIYELGSALVHGTLCSIKLSGEHTHPGAGDQDAPRGRGYGNNGSDSHHGPSCQAHPYLPGSPHDGRKGIAAVATAPPTLLEEESQRSHGFRISGEGRVRRRSRWSISRFCRS